MPTYDYRCEVNGEVVEVKHRMNEGIGHPFAGAGAVKMHRLAVPDLVAAEGFAV